ncbi:condensation domain-containing protein [Streptomyces sp. GLT-R25]
MVSGARSAPATSEQQRLWLLQRRSPGSRAYSVNQVFRVDGPVDTAGLRRALRGLVTRHEALRTSFGPGPDGLEQTVGEPYDPWHEPGPRPALGRGRSARLRRHLLRRALRPRRPPHAPSLLAAA